MGSPDRVSLFRKRCELPVLLREQIVKSDAVLVPVLCHPLADFDALSNSASGIVRPSFFLRKCSREGAVPSFEGNAEMLDEAGNGFAVNGLGILANIFCVVDI